MKEVDWIIYYNEPKGNVGCIPVGSKEIPLMRPNCTTLKGFHGTAKEAEEERKRIQKERFGHTHGFRMHEM